MRDTVKIAAATPLLVSNLPLIDVGICVDIPVDRCARVDFFGPTAHVLYGALRIDPQINNGEPFAALVARHIWASDNLMRQRGSLAATLTAFARGTTKSVIVPYSPIAANVN